MTPEQLALMPLWYAVFLLSVTCHEAAHAFAAWRGGDPTAYHGGQVTLNPVPHIRREPVGTVVFPVLSFLWGGWMMGWASAPYDPYWEERHPRRAAAMAAAGPAANLLLAILAFALLKVGLSAGWWGPTVSAYWEFDRLVQPLDGQPGWVEGLGRLTSIVFSLNLLLLLFNLLPLPPLDGAAVAAGLWEPARRLRDMLRATPGGGLIGLIAAIAGIRYLFVPIFRITMGWLFG